MPKVHYEYYGGLKFHTKADVMKFVQAKKRYNDSQDIEDASIAMNEMVRLAKIARDLDEQEKEAPRCFDEDLFKL